MCIHENTNTPAFRKLEAKFSILGFVALTLVQGSSNFTMFVNPKIGVCVERAFTDLINWHPNARLSEQSADRLSDAPDTAFKYYAAYQLKPIAGRNVPDSLDLEEDDFDAVYKRCAANGYFDEIVQVPELAGVK